MSSRVAPGLPSTRLVGNAECATLKVRALEMTSQESTDALAARLGKHVVDVDMAVRLHETCSGWPLGLQLMSSAIESGAAPASAPAHLGATRDVDEYFEVFLLERLAQPLLQLLLRVSLVEGVSPDFCVALAGRADAADQLKELCASTPVLSAATR